jgi:hypothetical protein
MTISVPKLVLLIILILAAWYLSRVVNRGASVLERRRRNAAARPGSPGMRGQGTPGQGTRGLGAVEDLVSCRTCGAYVSPGARHCGRPACPQPR